MSLRKREDIVNRKRKNYFALFGGLALEEARDLS